MSNLDQGRGKVDVGHDGKGKYHFLALEERKVFQGLNF